ncbi:hypothetical protein PGB34_02745 [Xenophilus arseniciresistens]|uniref:Uncharacterized protein n=1 Tax=Xenophilus arseniciresistens TaxID=1283306 RepID=A0AAE3N652_9BURK|nr:hypothetical protein [Xenophilus arseniciresistens]MDA7415273.1 hypothetical protein [Xenophilus arseniciresistens]
MTDRLEMEVHVTDAQGRPISDATLWISTARDVGLKTGEPNLEAMQRIATRYASQNDFLSAGDLTVAVFRRTDVEGIYREDHEARTSDKKYPYVMAAIKRGYQAQAIEGTAMLNRRHTVTIRLQRDPQAAPIDPRMEELDRLMALTRAPLAGEDITSEARMRRLEQAKGQLQALAQTLEKEGKNDEASAAYWQLADYPSVTNKTSADGSMRIVGYANGGSGPQQDALQLKAIALNTRTPDLQIDKRIMAKGFSRHDIRTKEHGLAYLEAFNEVANNPSAAPVLPRTYEVAIYQSIRWTTPGEACALLQRAYRFEPFMMPLKRWRARLDDIRAMDIRHGLPARPCVIDGLPST